MLYLMYGKFVWFCSFGVMELKLTELILLEISSINQCVDQWLSSDAPFSHTFLQNIYILYTLLQKKCCKTFSYSFHFSRTVNSVSESPASLCPH